MEYIYATLLLDQAGKKITEENVGQVLESAGVKADASRMKALVSSLEGVDIKEVISKAAISVAAPSAGAAPVAAKEEEKEEEKVSDAEAAAGLGALFG